MKYFLKKIALFFIPIIVLALVGEYIVNTGLKNSNYREIAEWKDINKGKINADIIINGSSRAQVHVSPKILDSVLDVNSYNLGLNAFLFNMEYACYQYYRQKNEIKPKLIIQIVGMEALNKRENLHDAYQFYPFYNEEEIVKVASQYNGYLESDRVVPFLRYLKNPDLIEAGIDEFFNLHHYKQYKYKGFGGYNRPWDNSFDAFIKNNPNGKQQDVDSTVVTLFESFIKETIQDSIPMILVYAPEYYEVRNYITNHDSIVSIYQNYSQKYKIPFLNYANDSMCFDKSLFYNSQHLNATGAQVFSEKLASYIKRNYSF